MPPVKACPLDPEQLLARFREMAAQQGFREELMGYRGDFPLFAFTRRSPGPHPRIYISSGVHGDERTFFYYQGPNLNAVRKGKWKLIFPSRYTVWEKGSDGIPGAKRTLHPIPLSLFNLNTDVGETTNVAAQHPLIVDEIQALADAARLDLGDGQTPGANVRPLGGSRP